MSTTAATEEKDPKESATMGVASIATGKRRLADGGDSENAISAKIAKRELVVDTSSVPDTITHNENNSDFLATSILAQTLLTSSNCPPLTVDPLESLKSSLEALPAPDIPVGSSPSIFNTATASLTIHGSSHNQTTNNSIEYSTSGVGDPSSMGILSPIDENSSHRNHEWSLPKRRKSITLSNDEVITEEENGKSYFNLGTADTSIGKKCKASNSWAFSIHGSSNGLNGNGNMLSSDMNDDASSSSSCDSLSSEDMFNSGEEFDGSDDEDDEIRSYKQQRSTVLHLSLCKLNKFRSQCVEPSLHRSVLICNTLRHIEQEIKNEDEFSEGSLRTRETLPPFWSAPSKNCHAHSPSLPPLGPGPFRSSHGGSLMMGSHDPYLSPNPYCNNSNHGGNDGRSSNDPPYMTAYDYDNLRPTPFHATSYDYDQDLQFSSTNTNANSTNGVSSLIGNRGAPITLLGGGASDSTVSQASSGQLSTLECDAGYASEDLDLSTYYYGDSTETNSTTVATTSSSTSVVPSQTAHNQRILVSEDTSPGSSCDGTSTRNSSLPGYGVQVHCSEFISSSSFSISCGSDKVSPEEETSSVTDPEVEIEGGSSETPISEPCTTSAAAYISSSQDTSSCSNVITSTSTQSASSSPTAGEQLPTSSSSHDFCSNASDLKSNAVMTSSGAGDGGSNSHFLYHHNNSNHHQHHHSNVDIVNSSSNGNSCKTSQNLTNGITNNGLHYKFSDSFSSVTEFWSTMGSNCSSVSECLTSTLTSSLTMCPPNVAYVQQDIQCGIESLRADFNQNFNGDCNQTIGLINNSNNNLQMQGSLALDGILTSVPFQTSRANNP